MKIYKLRVSESVSLVISNADIVDNSIEIDLEAGSQDSSGRDFLFVTILHVMKLSSHVERLCSLLLFYVSMPHLCHIYLHDIVEIIL